MNGNQWDTIASCQMGANDKTRPIRGKKGGKARKDEGAEERVTNDLFIDSLAKRPLRANGQMSK